MTKQFTAEFRTYTGQIRAGVTKYGIPCSQAINEYLRNYAEETGVELKIVSVHSFQKEKIGGTEAYVLVVFETD